MTEVTLGRGVLVIDTFGLRIDADESTVVATIALTRGACVIHCRRGKGRSAGMAAIARRIRRNVGC